MSFFPKITSKIKKDLKSINTLNRKILLTPLSPQTEIDLRWQSLTQRIYYLLALEDSRLNQDQINQSLTQNSPLQNSTPTSPFLLKKSFNYLKQNWLVSEKPINSDTITKLYTINHLTLPSQKSQIEIIKALANLDSSSEHPILKAALAIQISTNLNLNNRIGRLLSYLFLYKHGLNFKDLLTIEEGYLKNLITYRQALHSNTKDWLEYFASNIKNQLKKTYKHLTKTKHLHSNTNKIHKLNPRQRQILDQLQRPQSTITNSQVQDQFKVSQITASRDLTKLNKFNFVITHGQGRSVYYTLNP